jgi:hypothetical protein
MIRLRKECIGISFVICCITTGCFNYIMARSTEGANTQVYNLGYVFDARGDNYAIEILDNTNPPKPYIEIAKLESNFVFNTLITSRSGLSDIINRELTKQARLLGGDVVVITSSTERTVGETRYTNISSTVLRYK